MIAATKLFEENSIGMSQSAVKAYLGMKAGVRLGMLII
jgi:predicted transcriptional regulator